ncbi:hypothetical protein NPIL_36781 [Nephila pilipes]|uniref:Uncharacterized protein n=1 Tax=Nephila pilipes TaxID=299642 RepID=A0A8X6TN83_NEPPI|nr:hypothetical protein NPIL_36781 [Nephila pilipes]
MDDDWRCHLRIREYNPSSSERTMEEKGYFQHALQEMGFFSLERGVQVSIRLDETRAWKNSAVSLSLEKGARLWFLNFSFSWCPWCVVTLEFLFECVRLTQWTASS